MDFLKKPCNFLILIALMILLSSCNNTANLAGKAEFSDPAEFKKGLKYYSSKNPDNRILAITHYFMKSDDPKSRGYIIKALDDNDAFVRAAAINALVELEGYKSIDYILKMLADKDVNNVKLTKKHIKSFGKEVNPLIYNHLDSRDYKKRLLSITAMGILADRDFIDILGRFAIDENDHKLRIAAIKSLGKIDDPGAMIYITQALKDRVPDVKATAILNLKRNGSLDFVKIITPALEDNNKTVVMAAIEVLGENKNPKAVEPLINVLYKLDSRNEAIKEITEALSKLGDKSTIGYFYEALEAPQQYVRYAALKAAVDSENREWADEIIAKATENDMTEIKSMAIFALRKTAPEYSLSTVLKAVKDPDQMVRLSAVKTLADLPGAEEYEQVFDELLEDSSIKVRVKTVDVLPRVNAPWVRKKLIDIAHSDDKQMAVSAIYALGSFSGDRDVAGMLGQALDDSDTDISNAASNSLIKMRGLVVKKVLLENLESPSPNLKIRSLRTLERMNEFPSVGTLNKLVNDNNRDVREYAIRILKIAVDKQHINPAPVEKPVIKQAASSPTKPPQKP